MKKIIHKQLEKLGIWQSRIKAKLVDMKKPQPLLQAKKCAHRVMLALLFLVSCNKCPEKVPPYTFQKFTGREERLSEQMMVRRPVYRAKVPIGWTRLDPEGLILDTTQPNVTFLIDEDLKLVVHTFPAKRIPPLAQIERWKGQLSDAQTIVEAAGHGGFAGFFLEAPTVLAWSLQLDFEHYQTLSFLASSPAEHEHFKQMQADFTIKVTGPQKQIAKHRDEILLFESSFELIQEIPKRM